MMSLGRQPISHRVGGVPVRSQARRALCNKSIMSLEMYLVGSACGCLFPRRRCNVVHIAMVHHDQFGRGASCLIAMCGSCLYGGRGETCRFLARNYCRRAMLRFVCILGGGQGMSLRGSIKDQ